jgi:hypothetical protein
MNTLTNIKQGETSTKSQSTQSTQSTQPATQPPVNVTFTGDSVLVIGFALWALVTKVIAPMTLTKVDNFLNQIQKEKEINTSLAQIGIITNASRVILCAFHNGQVDFTGYHLQKMSAINSYIAKDSSGMASPIRDILIGSFIEEIQMMLETDDWVTSKCNEDLPQACRDYLSRNGIQCIHNRLVKVGNLPIGILSVQYGNEERDKFDLTVKENKETLDALYFEVSEIMRTRFIKPSPLRKLFKWWPR